MARIAPIDPAEADAASQEQLAGIQKALGRTPNIFTTAAASPAAFAALMQSRDALGHGRLRLKTREAIAVALAQYNECEYCLSAHTASSASAGLKPEDISAARRGTSPDARTDAAVKFALNVARNQGRVTDAELDTVRSAGYSDGEIIEIVANVVVNIFTNYLNNVAQTDVDFPLVSPSEAA